MCKEFKCDPAKSKCNTCFERPGVYVACNPKCEYCKFYKVTCSGNEKK
jgi:hypothetical protein